MQSTLHPAAGGGAALIHELGLVLYLGTALIFAIVMALALHAAFGAPRPVRARRWIVGGGLVFPIFVLTLLLLYALAVGGRLANPGSSGPLQFLLDCVSRGARALNLPVPGAALRVQIDAHQWWWRVRYHAAGLDPVGVGLANELHLPAGRPVRIELRSADVIHSFWVPALAGKVDMIPGRSNHIVLHAERPGVYRGQCAEYCGGQHAWMAFYVVVEPEAQFQQWLARQAQPARAPEDAFLQLGQKAFLRGGCGDCHTVRGTAAAGQTAPDLTHVGSRRSLAAGRLGNHIGTMAGWIGGAQDLKPGNLMPSMRVYTGRELRAVSAWLESLE